jgi:demethylmenaquinone methyltransferase/2-methoxy-6-polyprenyl-1,4-benzoquinol methylase
LRTVVPIVGGLISGHGEAYRYLNQTIERFPCGAAFCAIMADAGFHNVTAHPLLGGIATIYVGEK